MFQNKELISLEDFKEAMKSHPDDVERIKNLKNQQENHLIMQQPVLDRKVTIIDNPKFIKRFRGFFRKYNFSYFNDRGTFRNIRVLAFLFYMAMVLISLVIFLRTLERLMSLSCHDDQTFFCEECLEEKPVFNSCSETIETYCENPNMECVSQLNWGAPICRKLAHWNIACVIVTMGIGWLVHAGCRPRQEIERKHGLKCDSEFQVFLGFTVVACFFIGYQLYIYFSSDESTGDCIWIFLVWIAVASFCWSFSGLVLMITGYFDVLVDENQRTKLKVEEDVKLKDLEELSKIASLPVEFKPYHGDDDEHFKRHIQNDRLPYSVLPCGGCQTRAPVWKRGVIMSRIDKRPTNKLHRSEIFKTSDDKQKSTDDKDLVNVTAGFKESSKYKDENKDEILERLKKFGTKDPIAKGDETLLEKRLEKYGMKDRVVKGDGNCQFRALSDQIYDMEEKHGEIRSGIIKYMMEHVDTYQQWVVGSFGNYLDNMSQLGEYGDHLTLQAFADLYNVKIHVITSYGSNHHLIIDPQEGNPHGMIYLSYYEEEQHYNSLHPISKDDITTNQVEQREPRDSVASVGTEKHLDDKEDGRPSQPQADTGPNQSSEQNKDMQSQVSKDVKSTEETELKTFLQPALNKSVQPAEKPKGKVCSSNDEKVIAQFIEPDDYPIYIILADESQLKEKPKQRIFRVSHKNIRLDTGHMRIFGSIYGAMCLFGFVTMILVLFWWWTPLLPYYVDEGMPYAAVGWAALFCLLMAHTLRDGVSMGHLIVHFYSILVEDIILFWITLGFFPFVYVTWTLCFKPMNNIEFIDTAPTSKKSKEGFWHLGQYHMRCCLIFRQFCVFVLLPYFLCYKFFSYIFKNMGGWIYNIFNCKCERPRSCCEEIRQSLRFYSYFKEFEQHLSVLFKKDKPLWDKVKDEEGSRCMRNMFGLSQTLIDVSKIPGRRKWLQTVLTLGVVLKVTSHLIHTEQELEYSFTLYMNYLWSVFWIAIYVASLWALMSFEDLIGHCNVDQLELEEYKKHKNTLEENYKTAKKHAGKRVHVNVFNSLDFDQAWTSVVLRFSVTSWIFCFVVLFGDRHSDIEGRSGMWEKLQSLEQINAYSMYMILAPAIFLCWAPVWVIVSNAIHTYCIYIKYSLIDEQYQPKETVWKHVALSGLKGVLEISKDAEKEEKESWNNFALNWQINCGLIEKFSKLISTYVKVMFVLVVFSSVLALMQLSAVVFEIDWYAGRHRYAYSASTILLWSCLLTLTTVFKMQLINQIREDSMEELKVSLIRKTREWDALQNFESVVDALQRIHPIVVKVGGIQMRGFQYHLMQLITVGATFGWALRMFSTFNSEI